MMSDVNVRNTEVPSKLPLIMCLFAELGLDRIAVHCKTIKTIQRALTNSTNVRLLMFVFVMDSFGDSS